MPNQIPKQPGNRTMGAGRIGPELEQSSAERVAKTFTAGSESLQHTVSDYPVSSLFTCFAIGAAVGVGIGLLLTQRPEPRWHERIPDAMGRRWLESLLHSLPESVRSKVS